MRMVRLPIAFYIDPGDASDNHMVEKTVYICLNTDRITIVCPFFNPTTGEIDPDKSHVIVSDYIDLFGGNTLDVQMPHLDILKLIGRVINYV